MRTVLTTSQTFGKYSSEPVELLEQNGCTVSDLSAEFSTSAELPTEFGSADALIVGTEKIDAQLLKRMSALKVVAKHGAGIDNIDTEAAERHGIAVTNAPGLNRDAVADYVIGLLLDVSRGITASARAVQNGQWPCLVGTGLHGKTLGVVGTGAIGTAVIERSLGFGMRLLGHDLHPDETLSSTAEVRYVALDELLTESDFVTLHVDLRPGNRCLIGREQLLQMKSNAFLVNTARGGLIDESVLHEALANQWIGGAALDVFESEPFHEQKLLKLNNFLATPHVAGYTLEALHHVGMRTAHNVLNELGIEIESKPRT